MSELTQRSTSSPVGSTSNANAASSDVELTSTFAITVNDSRPVSSLMTDRPDATAQLASSTSDTTGAATMVPSPASFFSTSSTTTTPASSNSSNNAPTLMRAATVGGGTRPPSISEDIQQHLLQNQKRSHSSHHSHHHTRHHHHTSIGVDLQQPSSNSPPTPAQSQTVDPHRSLLAQAAPNDLVFLNSSLLQELQYYDVLTRELSSELEASLQHVSVLSKEVSAAHTSAEEALVQVEVMRAEKRRENVVREEERKKKWKEVKELKNQIEKLKAAVRQQGLNPTNVLSLNLPNGAASTATITNMSSSTGTMSTSSIPPQYNQLPSPINAHSRAVLLTQRDSGASALDKTEVRIDMSETVNTTTTTNASTTLLPRKRAQLRKPKQRSSETQDSTKTKRKSKKPKRTETRINENSLIRSSESEEDSDDEASTSDSDEERKMLDDGEESDSSDEEEEKFGENEKDDLKLVQSIDGIGAAAAPGRTLSKAQKDSAVSATSNVLQPPLSRQSSSDSQQSIASPSNASFGTASPFVPSSLQQQQHQLSSSLPTNLSMLPDAALSPAPPSVAASPHPLLHLGLIDDPAAPVPATEYLSLYEAHAIAQERITRLENRLVEQQRNWVMYLDLVQSRSRVGVRRRENSSQTGMVLNTPAEAVLADFAQEKLVFVTPSIWRAVAKSLMARDRARKEEKIRQEEAALAFTAAPSQPVQIYTSTPATAAASTASTTAAATSSTSASSSSSATAVTTDTATDSKSTSTSTAVSTSAFHDADLVIPIDDTNAPDIARTSELSVVPPKHTFYYTPAATSAATTTSSAQTVSAATTSTTASSSSTSISTQDEERVIIPRVQQVDSSSSSSLTSASSIAAAAGATSTATTANVRSPSPNAARSLSPMPMPPTLQMSPPVSPRKAVTAAPPATTTSATTTAAAVSLFTRTTPGNATTSSSLPSSLQSPATVSGRIAPSIITAQPRPGITIHGFSPAGRASTAASSVITPTASSFANASSPQARSASNTTSSASINKYLDMALLSSARRKANLNAAAGGGGSTGAAKQLDFGASKATTNTNSNAKPNEEAKTSATNDSLINGQTKH